MDEVIVLAKALKTLRERVEAIVSTPTPLNGSDGLQGVVGASGKQGETGAKGADGAEGKAGKEGKQGKTGETGVSVVDAEIAADGSFVFKLSNGKEIDAGSPLDFNSKKTHISTLIQNKQVTVSATAPLAPSVGDLWYDIS